MAAAVPDCPHKNYYYVETYGYMTSRREWQRAERSDSSNASFVRGRIILTSRYTGLAKSVRAHASTRKSKALSVGAGCLERTTHVPERILRLWYGQLPLSARKRDMRAAAYRAWHRALSVRPGPGCLIAGAPQPPTGIARYPDLRHLSCVLSRLADDPSHDPENLQLLMA